LVTAPRQTDQFVPASLSSDVPATTPLGLSIDPNKDRANGSRLRRRRKPSAKRIIKDVQSCGLEVRAVMLAPDGMITVEISTD
jgi:hypothetical protein